MSKKENYLDYTPKHNELFPYRRNQKGLVELTIYNKGMFNRLAQFFFKRPRTSQIELDRFGSFAWSCMDGKRSIYDIGKMVNKKFGAEAEPLYERLTKYCKILHDNHFIVYVNKM